ncbi:hypothetical protein SAMN04488102_10775 [Alkalibacterium subtropicum]|uniref:Uncharacterized protein n=1 Tax=Alkalibacterium subtropicum TaxID=753702 RepID=A0A1I1JDC8_9LACT|nr:hypothetical protein [Alkalibacterium subtropicum]SFC46355.1 hypothetical protein SAMN04488102_10775 [Alkalibacterium subtropicum]
MVLASSFLLFVFFAFYILYSMIQGNIGIMNTASLTILGIAALFLAKQLGREWQSVKSDLRQPMQLKQTKNIYTLAALVTGAYVTFFLNHQWGLGGVLASAGVGLAGAYLFKKYAVAIYCGSFVGMACNIVFSNPWSFLLASLLAGVIFILAQDLFKGFGGKLGFMAFCGTVLASVLFRSPLRTLEPLSSDLYMPLLFIIIAAGMATYFLQDKFSFSPVTASALVGLIIAVLSPDPGHILVVAAFCATFAGMVSKERAKNYPEMFFLTLLTAILFIAVASLFDGSGGKLGATAFLATVSGRGLLDTLNWVKTSHIKPQQQSIDK